MSDSPKGNTTGDYYTRGLDYGSNDVYSVLLFHASASMMEWAVLLICSSFHSIFHVLVHLILHHWGIIYNPYTPPVSCFCT